MSSESRPKWFSLIDHTPAVKKKRVAEICSENLGQTTAPTGQFDTTRSNVLQEIKRCSPIGKPVRRRRIVATASASEILEYQIASDSESENFVAGTLPALCSKATSSCKGENLEDYLQSSDSEGSLSSFQRAPHARQPSNLESLSHVRRSTSPFVFPDIEDNSQAVKGQIDFAVISSSSEEEEDETSVCDQKHPLHKGLDPATLFSATEEHQQTLFRKYFPPPANIIRSKLSARLDTLLHRHQSNRVIWLHKKNSKEESGAISPFSASSGTKDDHAQQTFRIKSIRLPSQVFIRRYASQVCLLASTEDQSANVIIFIPSSTLTDEQLNLLRGRLGRHSLEVSLFKPWYELRTAPTLCTSDRPTRTIFAPFMAAFRRSSVPTPPDESIHLSVECDCLKKGSTETCPRRYGPWRADHDRLLWTPEVEPATSSLLVLHKSLCWCQHKLRFVFILNFTGGFLAVLLVPTSVFAVGRQGMRRTSCALANLGAGCVCEVSDLQALPQASDDEFSAKILEHISSVREIVGSFFEFERSEDSQLTVPACLLADKTSTASSEETPSTNVPFFLLQSGKGQLTFKSSLFSEESTSPPFSSQLSPGSRCTLKCVLLHEFPAGSISAEKIVTAISVTGEYPDLVPTSSPIVLLAYLQGQDLGCFSPFSILICTREAATPMAVLNSNLVNFPISCDQQGTCWTRLMVYGVIFLGDFFLVDAFSRIEVIEASPLSDPRLFSSPTTPAHTSPPSAASTQLSANLFSASGTIIAVDSECSQLWPLCASCLSDDLEPCPPDPELQLPSSGSSSDDALLCSRCLARLSRPYYAVEVIVEAQFNSTVCPAALSADAEDVHRIHVCMESARVCELLGLSANKLHQASCLDPAQLIDRDVGVISGVLIHLPHDPDSRPSRRKSSSSSSSSSFKSAQSFVVAVCGGLVYRLLALSP